jgi:hypothetical protein
MHSTMPSKYRQVRPAGPVCNHVVQFYEDERFLIDEIGRDIAAALDAGEGAIVIATQPHRDALHQYLRDMGKDIAGFTPLVVAFALAAAVLFAAAFVLWWVLVYPANLELATWVNGPVPADWTKYRAQWEWGHATIVVVELLGFAALIWSVLADTPRWQPTPQRGR